MELLLGIVELLVVELELLEVILVDLLTTCCSKYWLRMWSYLRLRYC